MDTPFIQPYEGTAYHYTDAAGLIGMVTAGTVRATESAGLNDPREIDYGAKILRDFSTDDRHEETLTYYRSLAESVDGMDATFVVCSSTKSSDVSQWQRYTRWPDAGFCVGLDATVPLAVVLRGGKPRRDKSQWHFKSDHASTSQWAPVIYGKDRLDDTLARYLEWAASTERIPLDIASDDPEDWDISRQERIADIASELLQLPRFAKDASFEGENEVRVVAALLTSGDRAKFRPSRYGVVRYVELAAVPAGEELVQGYLVRRKKQKTTLPIISVTISPTPYAERSLGAVSQLLHQHGYAVEPTVSEAKFW